MLVDSTLGGLAEAADRARALEATGFDGLWCGEMNQDPFLPLAVAAEVTEHIRIGTSIAVAPARSPMTVAYLANDLQRHSRGRFALGLGSQVKAHIERRFGMPWGKPATRMREFVLALRAIWSAWQDGTGLDFRGEYYRHTLMPPDFVSPRHDFGPPRVLLAGVGDRMTAVAGEVADGFICHGFSTARWLRERTLPALRSARAAVGTTMDGFEIVHTPFLVTGDERDIEAARARIAFYASTPAYRDILALHGWDEVGAQLTALSRAGRWPDMAGLITDDILDAFAVVAPPAELPDRIAERFGGIVTRLSLMAQPGIDPADTAEIVRRLRGID